MYKYSCINNSGADQAVFIAQVQTHGPIDR